MQSLIAAGHSLRDVSQYTLEQIELFSAEAAASEKARARVDLIVARGSQADKAGFKTILKELS